MGTAPRGRGEGGGCWKLSSSMAASPARNDDDNGLVPVFMQPPVLYFLASVILDDAADDEPAGRQLAYALCTDDVGNDRTKTTTMALTLISTLASTLLHPPPDPIIIPVAVGFDGNYLIVAAATMIARRPAGDMELGGVSLDIISWVFLTALSVDNGNNRGGLLARRHPPIC